MANPPLLVLIGIGALAGALSGLFGIGGGVIIVPALIYFAGFDQHLATGTRNPAAARRGRCDTRVLPPGSR
jgi:uncharacterized membrane protein YfcA